MGWNSIYRKQLRNSFDIDFRKSLHTYTFKLSSNGAFEQANTLNTDFWKAVDHIFKIKYFVILMHFLLQSHRVCRVDLLGRSMRERKIAEDIYLAVFWLCTRSSLKVFPLVMFLLASSKLQRGLQHFLEVTWSSFFVIFCHVNRAVKMRFWIFSLCYSLLHILSSLFVWRNPQCLYLSLYLLSWVLLFGSYEDAYCLRWLVLAFRGRENWIRSGVLFLVNHYSVVVK